MSTTFVWIKRTGIYDMYFAIIVFLNILWLYMICTIDYNRWFMTLINLIIQQIIRKNEGIGNIKHTELKIAPILCHQRYIRVNFFYL